MSETREKATSDAAEPAPRPAPNASSPSPSAARRSSCSAGSWQHRAAMVSLVVFVLLILLAYVGGALWKYDVGEITPDNSVPPSFDHPFGTDAVGKDQLAQVLRGTRISLQVSVMVAILATLVGTLWGSVAGYFGGRTDTIMMRIADLVLTLPLIAVAAMLAHNFGGTW